MVLDGISGLITLTYLHVNFMVQLLVKLSLSGFCRFSRSAGIGCILHVSSPLFQPGLLRSLRIPRREYARHTRFGLAPSAVCHGCGSDLIAPSDGFGHSKSHERAFSRIQSGGSLRFSEAVYSSTVVQVVS